MLFQEYFLHSGTDKLKSCLAQLDMTTTFFPGSAKSPICSSSIKRNQSTPGNRPGEASSDSSGRRMRCSVGRRVEKL